MYNVSPNNLSSNGFGLELSIQFSGGTIIDIQILNGGIDYNNSDTVIVPGDYFINGNTPLNDVTFEVYALLFNRYAFVGGGEDNTASGDYTTVSGGYRNTATEFVSTVSGGYSNIANCYGSTIGGGRYNTSSGYYTFVGGGQNNNANGPSSTIGGGSLNITKNNFDTIGGGYCNTTMLSGSITGAATVSGGYRNTSGNYYTFNGGGDNNVTLGEYSSIVGGRNNISINGVVQSLFFVGGTTTVISGGPYLQRQILHMAMEMVYLLILIFLVAYHKILQ